LPKANKSNPDKAADEIKSMKQELKALQEALVQLVDAMITEEKPGFKEIKKLNTLKKKALDSESVLGNVSSKHKTKEKPGKTNKPPIKKRS